MKYDKDNKIVSDNIHTGYLSKLNTSGITQDYPWILGLLGQMDSNIEEYKKENKSLTDICKNIQDTLGTQFVDEDYYD